jgi:predicted metal-dependent phosphoesterase TrpH
MSSTQPLIRFARPDLGDLRRSGLTAVDMHYHTNHSDSPTRVRDVMRLAARIGAGVAITDHNQVSGVAEAMRLRADAPDVLVIPGIEVSALEGPHILLYFYEAPDLYEFYDRHIRTCKGASPFMALRLSTHEVLEAAAGYPCLSIAAHPYGYAFLNRGLQKCIDKECLPAALMTEVDGVEVICGGMTRSLNRKAVKLAESQHFAATGGTDGHLLSDLAKVVTAASAENVEEYLDAISRRENCVIGIEKTLLARGVMGSVVLARFIPYTFPSLAVHYRQNIPRAHRFWRRARARIRR